MNTILKFIVIGTPVVLAVLNGANLSGAEVTSSGTDEAVSTFGSLGTAIIAYLLLR